MAQTFSPVQTAGYLSRELGRTITDKQVRGIARSILSAYGKVDHPGRQSHAYTVADVTAIRSKLTSGGSGASGTVADLTAAMSAASAPKAPKATRAPKARQPKAIAPVGPDGQS